MDEAVDEPPPPPGLPEEVVEMVTSLSSNQLRKLLDYARSRLQFMEVPLPELIESQAGDEIVRLEDYGYYAVVVKRKGSDSDQQEPPHAYVVTLESDPEGGKHLHWVDIGRVFE